MIRSELSSIAETVASFNPISLDEMQGVRLMNRTDTKFVISLSQLGQMLLFAKDFYRAQETLGERLIEYRTIYFDTCDWRMLRMHVTGHKTRQKVRARSYVGSHLNFVEIKKKDNHGRTRKKRIPVEALPQGPLTSVAADFVTSHSNYTAESLMPAIANGFRRITLVNNEMTERLTIDLDLHLENLRNGNGVHLADTVIVEVKRDGRAPSHIVDWLRGNGIRKSGFSKYCYGALLTDSSLPVGKMKPKMRRLIRRGLIPRPITTWRRWAA